MPRGSAMPCAASVTARAAVGSRPSLWNALIKKGPNTSKLEEDVGTTKRAAPGIAIQQQLRAPDSGDRILIARRLRRTLLGGVVTSSSFPLPLLFFFLFLGYISLTLRERIVGFWHL